MASPLELDHTAAPSARHRFDAVASSRVVGLDIARGLAVLGMLAAHALGGLSSVTDAMFMGPPSMLFFFVAGVTVGLTAIRRPTDDDYLAADRRARLMFRACAVFGLGIALLGVGFLSLLPMHGVLLAMLAVVLPKGRTPLVLAAAVIALVCPQIMVISDSGTFGGGLEDAPVLAQAAVSVLLPAAVYAVCSLSGLLIGRLLFTG